VTGSKNLRLARVFVLDETVRGVGDDKEAAAPTHTLVLLLQCAFHGSVRLRVRLQLNALESKKRGCS